jgi:fused signal recognition particle receptor
MAENQLATIVKESGLEETKAQFILTKFQNFFELAAEWEKKAKSIVVTNELQTAEMDMARVGRLFLREKRISVEKVRKELKEQALREGKAIDGIANVLKALIEPIEEHLEKQERFVEIREEAKREAIRLEVEKRIEEERIAKEKVDAEALEKAQAENKRLQAEAVEREQVAREEREKQNRLLVAQQEKAQKEKKVLLEKMEQERKAAAELQRAKDEQARKEHKAAEAKAEKTKKDAQAKLDAEKAEKQRLETLLKAQVECPKCHHKFVPAK